MQGNDPRETLFTIAENISKNIQEANTLAENIYKRLDVIMNGRTPKGDEPKEEIYPKDGPLPQKGLHNLHSSLRVVNKLNSIHDILIKHFGE